MRVKYKGRKLAMYIKLPIGVRNQSAYKGTIMANPYAELSEKDARALVKLDPVNFELAPEPETKKTEPVETDKAKETVEEKPKAKRKRGRPKKEQTKQ